MKAMIRILTILSLVIFFTGAGYSVETQSSINVDSLLSGKYLSRYQKAGTDYKIRIITPNPDIDSKMRIITPDPGKDYKIRIITPGRKRSLKDFTPKKRRLKLNDLYKKYRKKKK